LLRVSKVLGWVKNVPVMSSTGVAKKVNVGFLYYYDIPLGCFGAIKQRELGNQRGVKVLLPDFQSNVEVVVVVIHGWGMRVRCWQVVEWVRWMKGWKMMMMGRRVS
jgi:hypothetical protein